MVVDLASLADPVVVPQSLALRLGIREQPGRPVTDTLLHYFRTRRLLLILDNCEHLLVACAQMVDALLRGCPQLRILATSREAFGIAGEVLYPVPPLSTPDPQRLPPIEQLTQYEAVRLFTERATRVLPSFKVTNLNARALAQVCFQLDGIPLAIELAAARVKALSVEQIALAIGEPKWGRSS